MIGIPSKAQSRNAIVFLTIVQIKKIAYGVGSLVVVENVFMRVSPKGQLQPIAIVAYDRPLAVSGHLLLSGTEFSCGSRAEINHPVGLGSGPAHQSRRATRYFQKISGKIYSKPKRNFHSHKLSTEVISKPFGLHQVT